MVCTHLLVCRISNDLSAEQQIWRHLSAARHFCSAKILAGRAAMGDGGLIAEDAVPAQRNFQRKFALHRVGSTKFVVPPTIERSKVRRHARFVTCSYRAARGARGVEPLCFRKESRGNPSQGFPLGNFFLTADAVLLCAAKKNGVGTWTSWHVTPEAHWPYLATARSKNSRPWQALPKRKPPPSA